MKIVYDLSKSEDIEEVNRLIDEKINFEESDESQTEDNLETRTNDSDTDHEIEENLEEVENARFLQW